MKDHTGKTFHGCEVRSFPSLGTPPFEGHEDFVMTLKCGFQFSKTLFLDSYISSDVNKELEIAHQKHH